AAWETVQARYAPAHAGAESEEPAIRRAHAFLIKTQRGDGSWPMTSRPVKPGGPGSKSLMPITGAGSAWAVLGLVWSRPAPGHFLSLGSAGCGGSEMIDFAADAAAPGPAPRTVRSMASPD